MRVAIIGAGLQCRRRGPAVREEPGATLVTIASEHPEHAEAAARQMGCEASPDWQRAVTRSDVDVVFVCTPPHAHSEISIAAMRAGKHVLCEKPLCRSLDEAEAMIAAARETGRLLKCGFNHRHHPAVQEAKRRMELGELGKPIFARCRYGICGRPGYEKEWRADPNQAAGGQFIEQGTHALDLFRWFLGEVEDIACVTSSVYFTNQPFEDNGMAILRMKSGATASLHTSFTEWQNQFSFEVFGEDGYAKIEGLGASYGLETLSLGRRDFSGPFQDQVIQYRGNDISWRDEWREFAAAIRGNREPIGNGHDGREALRIGLAAYAADKKRQFVSPDAL